MHCFFMWRNWSPIWQIGLFYDWMTELTSLLTTVEKIGITNGWVIHNYSLFQLIWFSLYLNITGIVSYTTVFDLIGLQYDENDLYYHWIWPYWSARWLDWYTVLLKFISNVFETGSNRFALVIYMTGLVFNWTELVFKKAELVSSITELFFNMTI